jgi:hypothetical protein
MAIRPAKTVRGRFGGQMKKPGSARPEPGGRPSVVTGRYSEIMAGIEHPAAAYGPWERRVLIAVAVCVALLEIDAMVTGPHLEAGYPPKPLPGYLASVIWHVVIQTKFSSAAASQTAAEWLPLALVVLTGFARAIISPGSALSAAEFMLAEGCDVGLSLSRRP